ncbi:MAG: hypothetical protein J6S78_07700 [Lachnospiraceae bacterium]|nr:hypothetical protein [Lachnospiraceae bacterium]
MNIIKKGAAAIIRSYIIAAFDWSENMQALGVDVTLDDVVEEGAETAFLEAYDEVEDLAGLDTIRGTLSTYFMLAPITALMMVWNKIATRYISKHQ